MAEFDIPESFADLVANGERSYSIIGENPCDNHESMQWFMELVGVPAEAVEVDDRTMVTLTHPTDANKCVVITSYGLGDFDRHGYDVMIVSRP